VSAPADLYSRLDAVVKRQGLCVAAITENQNITYVALRTAIDNCAASLAANGLRRGQSVAASFTRPEFYLIMLFATNKIGAGMVFAGASDVPKLAQKPDRLLTDDRMPPARRGGATVMDASWFASDRRRKPVSNNRNTGDVPYTFGTSGSTGKRKFVTISESNLINRVDSYAMYTGGETRLLCTMGPSTAVATEAQVKTILEGGSVVLLPRRVESIPHYIDLFDVKTLLTTPLVLEDMIAMELPKAIFRCLDKVAISGAPSTKSLLTAVAGHICADITISYGSTEMGGIARCHFDRDDFVAGKVGKVVPGVDVELVDEAGVPVAKGTEGQIRIRRENALISMAYENIDDTGGERFVGGWFYPGDRGTFDAVGNLFIAGRTDDVINAGGNKYSLEFIESQIEASFNCRCVADLGTGPTGGAYLVVVIQSKNEIVPKILTAFIEQRFKRVGVERIYQTDTIEMTDTGKKDRLQTTRRHQTNAKSVRLTYQM
jgi:acyl-coenzyme A synthetase/AMP-(fatty) acid ligase